MTLLRFQRSQLSKSFLTNDLSNERKLLSTRLSQIKSRILKEATSVDHAVIIFDELTQHNSE